MLDKRRHQCFSTEVSHIIHCNTKKVNLRLNSIEDPNQTKHWPTFPFEPSTNLARPLYFGIQIFVPKVLQAEQTKWVSSKVVLGEMGEMYEGDFSDTYDANILCASPHM